MSFREMITRFSKGELQSEEMPAIAIQAIEEGYDSPSLCQLAVLEDPDPQRINSLFLKALDELQIRLPCAEPFLVVRRHPYEEPYHTQIEFLASNGVFACATDIYCSVDEIARIGRALHTFPSRIGDEYKYEYGSSELSNFYRHFILRAYTTDRAGHCALQLKMNLNQAAPDEGICQFSDGLGPGA